MSLCVKPKKEYDFEKEYKETKEKKPKTSADKKDKDHQASPKPEITDGDQDVPSCIEEIIDQEDTKAMLKKWEKLKRLKVMYDQRMTEPKIRCFRDKVLKQLKARIAAMPPEERRQWLTKLIRLAFLDKLKQIKNMKRARKEQLVDWLETADERQRNEIVEKLASLHELYETKLEDDVEQVLEMRQAKKEAKIERAKQLQMKIRLKRLQKLENVRKQEERKMRQERIAKIKELLTTKKHWQDEMIKKIEKITHNLAEDIAELDHRQSWFDKLLEEKKEAQERFEISEKERAIQEQEDERLRKENEETKLRKERKYEEIKTWQKEMKIRMWKLNQVKALQQFLENRQLAAEEDENLFCRKIWKKLTTSERKKVDVDPWAMKRKVNPRERGGLERRKLYKWIQSIVSSNKKKVVKKVHLKKYLEAMETPQLNHLFSSAKLVESVQYIMCVLRGRIFRNTFPQNTKDYIARVFNGILVKARTDLRDIDPSDQLMMIHLTTHKHDMFFSTGEGYMMAIQQMRLKPDDITQEPEVLYLTPEERNKIIHLIKERARSKRIIKDRRMEEYDIYLNRRALDEAWMKYLKKAYEEAEMDLQTCTKGDEDVFNIELATEDETRRTLDSSGSYQQQKPTVKPAEKMIEAELKALLMQDKSEKAQSKEKLNISFETAMDKRLERLVHMVEDKREAEDTAYMHKKLVKIQDILNKEKLVRQHMIKDLPQDIEF